MHVLARAATVLALTVLASAASAQTSDLPNPPPNGVAPAAPRPSGTVGERGRLLQRGNGHQQPTQFSLPPDIRHEERSATRKPVDPLGPIPQICSGC